MLRVSDLERSLDVNIRLLGMNVLRRTHYQNGTFTNISIGYGLKEDSPTLELTDN